MAPRLDSNCPTIVVKTALTTDCACASVGKLPTLTPTTLEPACVSERGRAVLALSSIDAIRVTRHPTRESFVFEVFTSSESSNSGGASRAVSPTSGEECWQVESHIPTCLRDRHASIPMHRRFALTSDAAEGAANSLGCNSRDVKRERTPAVTFEKTLGVCEELRDALYDAALASHSRVLQCEYCKEVIEYVLWAYKVPVGLGARMLFHRERELDKVAALLSSFLSELLARTLSPPCVERAAAATAAAAASAGLGESLAGVPWCRAQSRVPVVVHDFLLQTPTPTPTPTPASEA